MTGAWTPLLEDDLAAKARETVAAISDDLERLDPARLEYRDVVDLALYFGYLARVSGDARHARLAADWLDAVLDRTAAERLLPGLYAGVAGVAWAVEHLGRRTGEPAAETSTPLDDVNAEVNDHLLHVVRRKYRRNNYDLIGGLVGIGVYFLEAMPHPSARAGLEEIVCRLDELSEPCDKGLRWLTPPESLSAWQRELAPNGYYNLGMAHGVPGIVAFLSQCVSKGVATPRSERVLVGAVHWLIGQSRSGSATRFDNWTLPGSTGSSRGSRLAWCYGDLGVALAILSAGFALREPRWIQLGIEIVDNCIALPSEQAGIIDAGLCHGAAGVAHIYGRVYQVTGDERVLREARSRYAQLIGMRTANGYGGYQSYRSHAADGTHDPTWNDDARFLTGSAGIGLALLAGVTDVPPEWDRLLLASFATT